MFQEGEAPCHAVALAKVDVRANVPGGRVRQDGRAASPWPPLALVEKHALAAARACGKAYHPSGRAARPFAAARACGNGVVIVR